MKNSEINQFGLELVDGFSISSIASGIRKSDKNDLVLVLFDFPAIVVGCFTKNVFAAAPVIVCKERIKNFIAPSLGALIINSGCANAGTGKQGIRDCHELTNILSKRLNLSRGKILPFSTGPIMERLPIDKIKDKSELLISGLGKSNWLDAASAIMTTDTVAKGCSKILVLQDKQVKITGIAKGSGMICPDMATMLAFLVTDIIISSEDLKTLVDYATECFFNRISVDGDTSTNDSIIAAANGASGVTIDSKDKKYEKDWIVFKNAFFEICEHLAKSIVLDGEGATKFITIKTINAYSDEETKMIGLAIANSPLVKTAFFASDPNLGRILAAIGNAGIPSLIVEDLDLKINGYIVFEKGELAKKYNEDKAKQELLKKEILVEVFLNRGDVTGCFFTCDLSYDYISINADYRT